MRGRSLLNQIVCVVCMVAVPAAMIATPVWAHSLFIPPTFCSGSGAGGGLAYFSYNPARPSSSKASPNSAPRTVKAISAKKEGESKGERAEESSSPVARVPRSTARFEPVLASARSALASANRPLRC